MHEVRYERMAESPEAVAEELAAYLGSSGGHLAAALAEMHAESIGRGRNDLDDSQLADVMDEAGDLLGDLGYVSSASA